MTRVCLVGKDDVDLRYELLSRETARQALATYDLRQPFGNAVGVETVSLGAAVSLLNDLDWYLVRFATESMVLEPSVSDDEWLSRALATAIRDDDVLLEESDRFLKVYGLEPATPNSDEESAADGGPPVTGSGRGDQDGGNAPAEDLESDDGSGAEGPVGGPGQSAATGPKRLVEPMYVTRTGDDIPAYDLRDVEETLVERVTESEFGA